MSREAFESEAIKHGFILDRLDKSGVYVQLITEQAWSMWQAATNAALERAAKVCEKLGTATNGIYERNQECAEAIRALKDES